MKSTIKKALLALAMLAVGSIAAATGSGGVAGAQSASSVTAFSGTAGGSSASLAFNRQTATVEPSTSYGGATTILNQSVGAAGVSGGVKTSTMSGAGNLSTGAGTGAASASGTSTASIAKENGYSTQNQVAGTVKGNAEGISASGASSGTNGAAFVSAGATANFAATADSSRTGLFSTNRTANTAALGTATTSTPTVLTWGSGSYGVLNEGAANASATAKSGSVTSSN